MQEWCCFGYAIDLLINLRQALDIQCDLHLVGDGRYGDFDFVNILRVFNCTIPAFKP